MKSLRYRSPADQEKGAQFLWLSSAGQCTHAHADQDFNLFVQLKGKKRFLLVGAEHQEKLQLFPRIHPLWHKSRLVADQYVSDAAGSTSPSYGAAYKKMLVDALPAGAVREVVLEPGELLYVPPLTWHFVETVGDEPSLSLTTWSHNYSVYHEMTGVYKERRDGEDARRVVALLLIPHSS